MSLDADNVFLVPSVQAEIASWRPSDQLLATGALARLGGSKYRNNHKEDLLFNAEPEGGKSVWGIEEGSFFFAFVEEDDGTVTVIHASRISRFGSHRWTPW